MKTQMVGHLRGDMAHRVERGHRVLRHHREEAAEEGAAAPQRGRQQILAVERDGTFRDPDAGRQDAQDRAAEQRHYADHRMWQDVYYAATPARKEAYIKVTMRGTAPVIQFKER
jgi:hypothetical protein